MSATTVHTTRAGALLHEAADLIEQHGLAKKMYMAPNRSLCCAGAINAAAVGQPRSMPSVTARKHPREVIGLVHAAKRAVWLTLHNGGVRDGSSYADQIRPATVEIRRGPWRFVDHIGDIPGTDYYDSLIAHFNDDENTQAADVTGLLRGINAGMLAQAVHDEMLVPDHAAMLPPSYRWDDPWTVQFGKGVFYPPQVKLALAEPDTQNNLALAGGPTT